MTESSSADPFSTFLNAQSGHPGLESPTPTGDTGGLPREAWVVLDALGEQRAVTVVELKAATRLPTMRLVRLLEQLEERGLARMVQDEDDDIAMITKAGRAALASRPPD